MKVRGNNKKIQLEIGNQLIPNTHASTIFPAFFFLFLNVILIVTLSATFPHHHITPLDSLVTHLGVSVFCHSRVVKVSLTFHLSAWAPLLGLVLSTWAKWPAAFLFLFFFLSLFPIILSLSSRPLFHSLIVCGSLVALASGCSCRAAAEAAVTYLHSSGTNRMVGCSRKVISPGHSVCTLVCLCAYISKKIFYGFKKWQSSFFFLMMYSNDAE